MKGQQNKKEGSKQRTGEPGLVSMEQTPPYQRISNSFLKEM
jgi:hypothetical protein